MLRVTSGSVHQQLYLVLVVVADLNRKVSGLTRELQTKDVVIGQERSASFHLEDDKIGEKLRRELIAKDRQIESLEEQLARYTDMSLRYARRGKFRFNLSISSSVSHYYY